MFHLFIFDFKKKFRSHPINALFLNKFLNLSKFTCKWNKCIKIIRFLHIYVNHAFRVTNGYYSPFRDVCIAKQPWLNFVQQNGIEPLY